MMTYIYIIVDIHSTEENHDLKTPLNLKLLVEYADISRKQSMGMINLLAKSVFVE